MKQTQSLVRKPLHLSYVAAVILGLLLSTSANAQVAALTTKMTAVQTTLLGLGAIILTIAFATAGYRMAFDGARFKDVSMVFIGGVVAGLAGALGAWIVS